MFIPGMPMSPYGQPQQQMPGQPGGAPPNVMQILAPPDPLSVQQAPQELPTAQPQLPQQALPDPSTFAEPRKRHSFLDTVGRISDVLAKVGGAEALYEPTLNARDDRARMIDMEAMKREQAQQGLTAGSMGIEDAKHARVGMALKGLQAIQKRGGDVSTAWPILAEHAGIPHEDAAQLGQIFTNDPKQIDGVASMFGVDKEFGLQPFYSTGADGKLQAFQLGKDGTLQHVDLPDGQQPIDPMKFVDTGNAMVGYGTRSGRPQRVMPKGERPGYSGGQPTSERPGYRDGRPIAPPPAPAGKPGSAPDPTSALSSIAELRGIYGDLHKMGATVDPKQSTGTNVLARVRSSGVGQMIEGAVGTEAQTKRDRVASIRPSLMQGIAKATGMTSKQLDSNTDVKLWMQTVTDPSASYEANIAALDGLERFVRANAARSAPQAPRASSPAAPRRGPARVAPRGQAGVKPSVSNW